VFIRVKNIIFALTFANSYLTVTQRNILKPRSKAGMTANEQSTASAKVVCGGKIKDTSRYPSAEYKGKKVYFCTAACREAFFIAPDQFVAGEIEHPE
jgi:YHS domain-containing protein